MKHVLGRTIFGSRLSAVLLRNVAVVVAFHRVEEAVEADDGLTISVRMFERHCRFFRRHFRVVPLRDIVEKLEEGRRLDRELAITFDDGYRDNFEAAAPILVVPWWDRERNVRYPWMTWDEVRALHRKGFAIGAHTLTHADLGKLSGAEAQREVAGARVELEREIGAAVDLFAYPYGGRDNLTEANRELVKAAGFRCCCSNFGGTNATGGSPFDLRRIPISLWHRSPHQFGFEVALRRSVLSA